MKLRIAAVLLSGVVAAGVAFAQDKPKAEKKKSEAKGVTVRLHEQNKSGESGTARLTPAGADKTKVEISLKGAPKGVSQPAHFHEGSCKNLDPKPKYALQNVADGKSTTEVPASIATLTGGNLAINVHKSAQEAKVYVACGDVTKGGTMKKGEGKKKVEK